MIRTLKKVLTTTVGLRSTVCVVVLCIGTCRLADVRATPWQSADDAEADGILPLESKGDGPPATLTDEEVLRLQSEKQDSMDRLEKTASEIARRWKEKRARKAADRPQPVPPKLKPFQKPAEKTSPKTVPEESGAVPGASSKPPRQDPDRSNEIDSGPSATTDTPQPETGKGSARPTTSGPDSTNSNPEAGTNNTGANSQNPQDAGSIAAIPVSSVVDGPIDRLGLATSLFATGELRECLKILEAVELRPLSVEDRQWHDYLAASCYRDLGNRSEAEGKYRSVLQRSSSTWISAAARWWLAHIDERADLEKKRQDVQTTIENWRKEIDALKTTN